uniref:Uncharacterized protein n=1 Tax=Magallana gigas TaxID=29159 RepID=A0A8W8IXN2_MAGGI
MVFLLKYLNSLAQNRLHSIMVTCQFVDGSQNGPAPGPWEIPATFKEIFKNEIQHHEVPHTAFVMVCCSSCNGIGSRTVTRNIPEHVIERGIIPAYMISESTGTLGFNEVLSLVALLPPPPTVFAPPQDYHHMIRMVPVTQCVCRRRGKEFTFFVYGLENKVYGPDYPDQCCWGCTIQ